LVLSDFAQERETGAYGPNGNARWIRAEASDAAGRIAWSQSFWIDA
jgi:hypothetical protein